MCNMPLIDRYCLENWNNTLACSNEWIQFDSSCAADEQLLVRIFMLNKPNQIYLFNWFGGNVGKANNGWNCVTPFGSSTLKPYLN
jgi:hypothetical protein